MILERCLISFCPKLRSIERYELASFDLFAVTGSVFSFATPERGCVCCVVHLDTGIPKHKTIRKLLSPYFFHRMIY